MQRRKSGSVLEDNWRESCRGIERRLKDILHDKAFLWDIGFHVETVVFRAHKMILAIGSPVFEDIFYNSSSYDRNVIVISDVDPVGFRNLLRFIYTGSVSFNSISEALSTCEAGHKYDVPELKDLSEKYLAQQDYKPNIVAPVLENAEMLDMFITKKKCLEFVRKNTREVLNSEGFLSVSFRVIQTILRLNEVSVPEIELLNFLARWVKRRTGRNSSNTQPVFDALAPHIRFKAIKPEELCTFLEENPECLDDNDSMQILKHLVKPNLAPLPEWCNDQPPRKSSLQPQRKTFAQKLWSTLKNPQLF